MRLASLTASFASIALAAALLVACGDDGTVVNLPHARAGLNGGESDSVAALGALDGAADGDTVTGNTSADSGEPVSLVGDASVDLPVTALGDAGDAASTEATDGEALTSDGGAQPSVAGCACGCTDPCLTELIPACKAPSVLLLLVCPKVPATCACIADCATPQPAPPSLDACATQFLFTGK